MGTRARSPVSGAVLLGTFSLTLGACNSISITGTGSEVEAHVHTALLANGDDCASQGPDGVTVHPYGPIRASDPAPAPQTQALLSSLEPHARALAAHSFGDPARLTWSYLRGPRPGIALSSLDPATRAQALDIFQSQLSDRGDLTIARVIALEAYLRQRSIDRGAPDLTFDPTMYFVSVWGEPAALPAIDAPLERRDAAAPWTARLEGHHLSLNFTTDTDGTIRPTPLFVGSQPEEVTDGPEHLKGVRNLGEQQDAFFALARSLTSEQLDHARLPGAVPRDIVTGPGRERLEGPPQGLPAAAMTDEQRALLRAVLSQYAGLLEADLRDQSLHDMLGESESALATTHFALAGEIDRTRPHYFRLHGPTLIIEFDCSSGDPDHLHTVWHDPRGGLAVDPLPQHHGAHEHTP
ncbi:MAG: DUF3500 domain-containing protein [Planctomycetota bacterium]|nr:DUF3500 domain-containing protein [Planctomycetota bacterium]